MINIIEFIQEKLKIDKDIEVGPDKKPDDPDTWGVGDILAGTWGYNMTLPIFYKIIKRTSKMITCVELSQKLASGHYNGSFETIPDDSKLDKDLKREQIKAKLKDGSNYVKVKGHYVHLWDGKPVWGNDLD